MQTKRLILMVFLCFSVMKVYAFDQIFFTETKDQILFLEKNVKIKNELFLLGIPAPTIILAHACGGDNAIGQTEWALKIRSWGFNVVKTDSFSPRNVDRDCGPQRLVTFEQRSLDFERVTDYIRQQSWHNGGVAIFGFSHGAVSGIVAANNKRKFIDAVVAYYPNCKFPGMSEPNVPILMHLGMADNWTPPENCLYLAKRNSNFKETQTYENATHVFDRKLPFTHYNGFKVGLEPLAAEQAEKFSKLFLSKHLRIIKHTD